jgi:hypothetical protein
MRGGRARWQLANEPFNTLKNQGDHVEHTDGPGAPHLAVVVATMMMGALLVDHVQQLCCAFCRAVWANLGSKRLGWERLRALCYAYRREAMRELLAALLYGCEQSSPVVRLNTSSSLAVLVRCGAAKLRAYQASRPGLVRRATHAASPDDLRAVWLSTQPASDQKR